MKLRSWDWDKQNYVEHDYPDAIIAKFVDWLRTTKAWFDDVELVHRRMNLMNRELAAHQQALIEAQVMTAKNLVAAELAAKKARKTATARANLAKGRAVKAAKDAERRRSKQAMAALSPDGELPRDL